MRTSDTCVLTGFPLCWERSLGSPGTASANIMELALDPPVPINTGDFIGVFLTTGRVARDAAGPSGFFLSGDQSVAVNLDLDSATNGHVQIGGDIAAP